MTVEDCTTYSLPPLPDHIIFDILTRLPAPSATRFKTVSKKWHSLILSPYFTSSFLSHNPLSWSILNRFIRVDPNQTHPFNLTLSPPPSVCFFSTKRLLPDIVESNGGGSLFPCLINGSYGLILFAINRKRDPHKEHKKNPTSFSWVYEKDNLFVCNPVTKKLVYLPDPPQTLGTRGVGFVTRVGTDSSGSCLDFVVGEFSPILGSESAWLMTFSSSTWKWEVKGANNELGMHMWRPDWCFEFHGVVYFVDLSFGLVAWDDPFSTDDKITLRYLSLPSECRMPFNSTPDSYKSRCIGAGGGCIQYLEIVKGRILNLWRLKDCEGGKWSVVCKVKMSDIWNDGSYLETGLPKVVPECEFVHPLEADVVVFKVESSVVVVNVSEKKVVGLSSYSNVNRIISLMPFVVPSWPTLIPPAMIAVAEKDRGNEYFKEKIYDEALRCYSTSILSSPTSLGYANRAAAYLKLNRHEEAEGDCTEALKLDDNYIKAYARRAIARKEVGKLQEAKEDIERALKMEPKQTGLLKQYDEIKFLLEKAGSY